MTPIKIFRRSDHEKPSELEEAVNDFERDERNARITAVASTTVDYEVIVIYEDNKDLPDSARLYRECGVKLVGVQAKYIDRLSTGDVFSRKELLRLHKRRPQERAVVNAIRTLRNKLEGTPYVIHNFSGRGYALARR